MQQQLLTAPCADTDAQLPRALHRQRLHRRRRRR
jgi:hypothetical protein